MIWESTIAMTVIDLLIIGVMVTSVWVLIANRKKLRRANATRGALIIVSGLLLIGAFYLADLLTMLNLSPLSDSESAMQVMTDLHLNFSWFIFLASSTCVLTGFILISQKVFFLMDQMEQSEARYQDLYEHAPDPCVSVHPATGNVLECNQTVVSFLGYGKEEILGRPVFDLYHPDSLEDAQRAFETFATTGEVRNAELQLRRKDGSTVDVMLNVTSVRDAQGNILKSRSVWRDITARKQAEEALRQTEHMTQQILDATVDMVLVKDSRSRILWANQAFQQYYGMSNAQLRNIIDASFNDPRNTEQYLEDDKRVFETGQTQYIIQEPVTRFDGVVRKFNTIKSPIFDDTGRASKLVAVVRDITESLKAEEALRTSEQRYRTLVEHSPYCIHEIDLDGDLISMNQAGLEMVCLKEESHVVGKPYLDFVGKQDKERIQSLLHLAYQGQSSTFEFGAGNNIYFQSSFIPIRNESGSVERVMGLTQNVTRVKETEQIFQNLIQGTASVTGGDFFNGFVEKITRALGVRFALVTELVPHNRTELRSLAVWHNQLLSEPMQYDIVGTPCEKVVRDGFAYYPNGIQEIFPEDQDLKAIDAEAYLGIRLNGITGNPLGHLCVVHDHPFPDADRAGSILTIFGARAAAELERVHAEEETTKTLAQLRDLTAQLSLAQEQERKRIAQELHDEFGQALTGLNFDLSWTVKQLAKQGNGHHMPQLQEKLHTMSSNVVGIIQSMRKIASSLRPSILDDLGLVEALEWEFREFQQRTGIRCWIEIAADITSPIIQTPTATALYRISQEFLTNVMRHAQASRVQLSLKKIDEGLVLELTDNGRGITQNEINNRRSLGIVGMKERAKSLGGDFHISGHQGKGTTVLTTIPFPQHNHFGDLEQA